MVWYDKHEPFTRSHRLCSGIPYNVRLTYTMRTSKDTTYTYPRVKVYSLCV